MNQNLQRLKARASRMGIAHEDFGKMTLATFLKIQEDFREEKEDEYRFADLLAARLMTLIASMVAEKNKKPKIKDYLIFKDKRKKANKNPTSEELKLKSFAWGPRDKKQ